jgi:hypothetical protein
VDRNTVLTVGVAVLAVVALSLAAATLDTATVSDGGGGFGVGQTGQPGVGSGQTGEFGTNSEAGQGGQLLLPLCYPVLLDPLVILGIVGAFALMFVVVYYQTRTLFVPATLTLSFGIPVVLLHALLTSCRRLDVEGGSPFASGNETGFLPEGAGSFGLSEATGQTVPTPSAILALVLVVALAGSVLLLFVASGGDDDEVDVPAEPEPDPDVAAVGRAAGAAADRIERDADVDNEVYRAWFEMTDHLDLSNPRASTPAEFAAAAVDAGMAREDVTELTDLFEEVRYGGEPVTEERESRAVAALRRIESAYAEGES